MLLDIYTAFMYVFNTLKMVSEMRGQKQVY